MTELTPDHPSIEEVRRHWGLAVDIHRRDERLAEFDRLIQSLQAKAWDQGWRDRKQYDQDIDWRTIPATDTNPYRKDDA